jgi:AraC-like DNA-binding protein
VEFRQRAGRHSGLSRPRERRPLRPSGGRAPGAGPGLRAAYFSVMTPAHHAFANDPLGEALHFFRMRGYVYCRSEFSAPWGISLRPMQRHLWFHILTSGGCRLEAEGAEPVFLRAGDIALVPHGEGHRLRSHPRVPVPWVDELDREYVSDRYEILRHGGGGERTEMMCCAVTMDHPAGRNLVALLPQFIHVKSGAGPPSAEWLRSTLELMSAEAGDLRPGGETVVTRLADILLVQAIRSWLESDPAAQSGWLGALRDQQIGRAIALIQQDPARDWTVSSLAREIAMSRSSFAARFTQLVGEPAMQYLARWRMHVAVSSLQEEGATVAELALRLGYRSEAAFSRAFKRVIGVPPGAVKRHSESMPTPTA